MQAGRPRQLAISHPNGVRSYSIDFVPFFDALQPLHPGVVYG